jgi:hypothetical protein
MKYFLCLKNEKRTTHIFKQNFTENSENSNINIVTIVVIKCKLKVVI